MRGFILSEKYSNRYLFDKNLYLFETQHILTIEMCVYPQRENQFDVAAQFAACACLLQGLLVQIRDYSPVGFTTGFISQ